MNQTAEIPNVAMPPVKLRRSVWQFSMRSMLIVVTGFALICAMIAFPPLAVVALVMTQIAVSIFTITAVIFGRGWIRAFAIIASISMLIGLGVMMTAPLHHPLEVFVIGSIQLFLSCFIGFCGAAAHGYLKRRSGYVPVPNVPFLRDWLVNPEEQKS
jgi:hypothetical protein